MKKERQSQEQRHMMQLIRRNMIQKVKPSGKVYSRKQNKIKLISPVRDEIKKIMANTFTQIYIHFVFAVQNRVSLIQPEWKDELYKYITGIVQKNGHKMIAINGTANHAHIFIGYKSHQLIPDLMQDVKGSSSKWINRRSLLKGNSIGRKDMVHFQILIHKLIRL